MHMLDTELCAALLIKVILYSYLIVKKITDS